MRACVSVYITTCVCVCVCVRARVCVFALINIIVRIPYMITYNIGPGLQYFPHNSFCAEYREPIRTVNTKAKKAHRFHI